VPQKIQIQIPFTHTNCIASCCLIRESTIALHSNLYEKELDLIDDVGVSEQAQPACSRLQVQHGTKICSAFIVIVRTVGFQVVFTPFILSGSRPVEPIH
jgi:hypothetical protein